MRIHKPSLKSFLKLGSACIFALLGAVFCSQEMPPSVDMSGDMSVAVSPDMVAFSCCGHPGDLGNSKGVGQYCTTNAQCTGSAKICSYAYAPDKKSYICTTVCFSATDTTSCGEGAICAKDSSSGLFGCVPMTCVNNPPPGCMN